MPSTTIDEKVGAFQSAVNSTRRIGVSEFARSRKWREELPELGCLEVVDRNGVVGYLLAPDYAQALSARISELEEQVEQASIDALFRTREDCTEPKTGEALKEAVRARFDERCEGLAAIVDGD